MRHAGCTLAHAAVPHASPTQPPRRATAQLFVAAAIAFGCAAVYHLLALAFPTWAEGSSPARHLGFVAINGALAFGILKRPRGFFPVFSVLCVQQLVSHGGDLVRTWQAQRQLDTLSALVLVALALIWWALWHERREQREKLSDSPRPAD